MCDRVRECVRVHVCVPRPLCVCVFAPRLCVCIPPPYSLGVVLYVLLCGFPPFMPPGRASARPIESQIASGSYAFYSPYWDGVSDEAKDLVSRLLVVDPAERLTARGCLAHPWFKTASPIALSRSVKERLRDLPAKKKFQRAGHIVASAIRLSKAGHGRTPVPVSAPVPPARTLLRK